MISTTTIVKLLYKHRSWTLKELLPPLGLFALCMLGIIFLRTESSGLIDWSLLLLMVPTLVAIAWLGVAGWRITDKMLDLEPELSKHLDP